MAPVMHDTSELDELFRAYARGEDQSFSRLYDALSPKIWGYLLKRVGNSELTEEVYQEVWTKLHKTRASFDPRYPALPWVFTLTRSVLMDHFRKRGRTLETPVQPEALEQWAGASPESTGEQVQESSWAELSHGLPPEDVKLLEDRYLNDWSFERLAQELKLSEAGVRKRLSRLLQKIRRTPV